MVSLTGQRSPLPLGLGDKGIARSPGPRYPPCSQACTHNQSSVVRLSFEAFVKHSSNSGIQSSCRSNVRAQAESGIRWIITPGKRAGRVLVQSLQWSCPMTELGSDHTKPTIVQKRRHSWVGCGPFLPVNLCIAPLSSLNLRCIVCSSRQRCDRIWRAVRC